MTVLAESTCPNTSKGKYPWIRHRESRRVVGDDVYVFSDGSSLGGFGAVLVQADVAPLVLLGFERPGPTRNIAAELNGALLGLSNVRADASVVLVADYLGVAAWLTQNWKIKDMIVRAKIDEIKDVIRANWLTVKYVHHRGHQKPVEGDDFTAYNKLADNAATRANSERSGQR